MLDATAMLTSTNRMQPSIRPYFTSYRLRKIEPLPCHTVRKCVVRFALCADGSNAARRGPPLRGWGGVGGGTRGGGGGGVSFSSLGFISRR